MPDEDLNKLIDNTSDDDAWKILKKINQGQKMKKKKEPKKRVLFPRTVVKGTGIRRPIVTTSSSEILQYISGELLSDIHLKSNASIKSDFVEAVEWMTELTPEMYIKKKLRAIACKVVLIDDRDHLINFMVTYAATLEM